MQKNKKSIFNFGHFVWPNKNNKQMRNKSLYSNCIHKQATNNIFPNNFIINHYNQILPFMKIDFAKTNDRTLDKVFLLI